MHEAAARASEIRKTAINEILERMWCALQAPTPDETAAKKAADQVLTIAFERLRERAHHILRPGDRVNRLVSPTELLNDVYPDIVRAAIAAKPKTYEDFLGLVSLKLRQRLCDYARKLIRERWGGGLLTDPADPDRVTFDAAEWDEFCQGMRKLVVHLSPWQRRILYHLDVRKLTQEQTAKRLRKDESTVKRALRPLKVAVWGLMAKYLLSSSDLASVRRLMDERTEALKRGEATSPDKRKPTVLDLVATHLLNGGDLATLPKPAKRKLYDIFKPAIVDAFWCECQAEMEALSPEEINLIDARWTFGLSTAEAAAFLKTDVKTLETKWKALLAKVSPMLRDLLKA